MARTRCPEPATIAQFGEGYDGPIGWNNAYAVSEYWVEGEPAPIVTIR
jgi:hypothetical protein